jgi:hypothetical protein
MGVDGREGEDRAARAGALASHRLRRGVGDDRSREGHGQLLRAVEVRVRWLCAPVVLGAATSAERHDQGEQRWEGAA